MSAPGRIAIVGASLAGARTLRALRRKGFDGEVVLIGEEDELPYDRPPLSKQFLTENECPSPKSLESPSFYDGVDLRLGVRAVGLSLRDRAVLLGDGSSVTADHVVVTTGSVARTLPSLDAVEGVTTLRTAADARRIQHAFTTSPKVVVVGGGFIGCEVAASARERGLQVTIVEALPAPVMHEVGVLVGGTIAALHRENDVDIRLGVTVAAFEADEAIRSVTLTDGTRLEADLVIVGIGANPRTDWLDGSGLLLRNGLACDEHCRVIGGDGHVWAAGDVASWPSRLFGERLRIEHWTNAVEQATAVAANLLDAASASAYDAVPYFWSDLYQHRYQLVGRLSSHDDTMLLQGSLRKGQFAVAYSRAGRLRGVVTRDMPEVIATVRQRLSTEPLGPLVAAGLG
jgi:3-phenylpropionate/trans-cinnamate dioxygenase ferredoxin reductase subunit